MAPAEGPRAFEYPIHVTWGDCDPARIAYTGRLPEFALLAINGWWEHHLDGDGWYQMEMDRGFGTPFVHLSLNFKSPVTPRHRLMCEVFPTALGTRSISFAVIGRQDGVTCFEGRFTCVFTEAGSVKTLPAPRDIRAIVTPLIRA